MIQKESLNQIYLRVKGNKEWPDKGDVHSYIEVYEDLLKPYRETADMILEIGLFSGESLLMWEQYFKGNVHGIDCAVKPHGGLADLTPLLPDHNIHILDATDPLQAKMHFEGMKFDVIIEDASHQLTDQVKIYNIFKHFLSEDGIYIIEDVDKIDQVRNTFENLDPEKRIYILDRRHVKGRFDDVLIVILPQITHERKNRVSPEAETG